MSWSLAMMDESDQEVPPTKTHYRFPLNILAIAGLCWLAIWLVIDIWLWH
jgi:hypothetical protein